MAISGDDSDKLNDSHLESPEEDAVEDDDQVLGTVLEDTLRPDMVPPAPETLQSLGIVQDQVDPVPEPDPVHSVHDQEDGSTRRSGDDVSQYSSSLGWIEQLLIAVDFLLLPSECEDSLDVTEDFLGIGSCLGVGLELFASER